MRRALAALVGALALAGVLSVPAHAVDPGPSAAGPSAAGPSIAGIVGIPVKAASAIGPLHIGELPLLGAR